MRTSAEVATTCPLSTAGDQVVLLLWSVAWGPMISTWSGTGWIDRRARIFRLLFPPWRRALGSAVAQPVADARLGDQEPGPRRVVLDLAPEGGHVDPHVV